MTLPVAATNPTPIFEHFRGSYATELLTAAVAHCNLFGRLNIALGWRRQNCRRGRWRRH